MHNNAGLQALPGWGGLPALEELRVSGPFRAGEVLRRLKDLPALRRVMLPDDPAWRLSDNFINEERIKAGLPEIAFRFDDSDSAAWWEGW